MPEKTLSPAGRMYGRHQPPPMPAHRMLTRGLPAGAPLYRDFRTADQGGTNPATAFCGPVKDQSTEGSCTGHEKTTNGEWIERAYFKRNTLFSPQYVYARELIANGNFPNDVGSDGETGCLVVIKNGLCEASKYPYVAGKILSPTPLQDASAAQFKMGAYHGITDALTAVSCLSDPVPWPVGMGFEVFESFESNEVAQSGVMPIPGPDEQLLGGHQVAACGGYDIGDVPRLRPQGCPPAMLIENSWGIGWGLKGFVWVPLPILNNQTSDLKIFHAGHPW